MLEWDATGGSGGIDPRSDEASGAVGITTSATQDAGGGGERGLYSEILKKMRLDVKMFSSVYVPARAPASLQGSGDKSAQELTKKARCFWAFMDCLICFPAPHGTEPLLRRWLAGKTRRRKWPCSESCAVIKVPLLPKPRLSFEYIQGKDFWPSSYLIAWCFPC